MPQSNECSSYSQVRERLRVAMERVATLEEELGDTSAENNSLKEQVGLSFDP